MIVTKHSEGIFPKGTKMVLYQGLLDTCTVILAHASGKKGGTKS